MNFAEFITRSEDISFDEAFILLHQIYINSHNWNFDDSIDDISEKKTKYIRRNILIGNVKSLNIKGEIVYIYTLGTNGDYILNDETGEYETEVDFQKSTVNIKSLVLFLVKEIKDVTLIPVKLLAVAGLDNSKMATDTGHIQTETVIEDPHKDIKPDNNQSPEMIKYAFELGATYLSQIYDGNELPSLIDISKHLKNRFKANKPPKEAVELLVTNLIEYQQQKIISKKMAGVGEQSNQKSKKIKDRINEVVIASIKPPCVCLHAQMKNRIVEGFPDPETGKCLWIENGIVSEQVLLDTVRKAYAKEEETKGRIQKKNTQFPTCPIHD